LKYGYARGMEPVVYVQRIRNYENIILEKLKQ
jgi:membrane-bound lytic murein transglycosylase F